MPKISLICVTNRINSVAYLYAQLGKQTFKDFEVIVADDAGNDKLFDKQFVPRQKAEGDVWNINKAYNDCLSRVEGELIVFLQDFIWVPSNGLERFWELYQLYPDALITGVGHKALKGLEGISEIDERALGEPGLSPGNYSHYELNWASCPVKLAVKFDEQMDKHYGGENQYFASQINKPIWIDRSNRCIGLSQTECGGRPVDWEERHFNKLGISFDKGSIIS